jgi:hypothetical protein
MLTLPNLPTENLYKFLALGGIVVVITSLLYVLNENQKVNMDNVKLETTLRVYNYKIETFKNKVKYLSEMVENDT